MKFLNGGWMLKDGFSVDYAAHVYDIRQTEDRLILYAPFQYVPHKGQTLDGGMVTIELSSPAPDVIGVKLYHHKGGQRPQPEFNLTKLPIKPEITEDDQTYQFKTGETTAIIEKGEHFTISFNHRGKPLTASKPRSKAYVKDQRNQAHMSEQLSIDVGELIYGLGERFSPFIKNGQSVDIWNEDGGTGTEQAYKNIPFYLSNRGYGVFVNSPDKVSVEVGSEKVSRVQFSVPGEEMEYFIFAGDSLKDVLGRYTDLTGKPTMPPAWSFGLWLSTSFLTDYDEETVNEFVDGMSQRDIPLEVFHFDCLWMKEYEWCNFTWDDKMFPEPVKMLQRLKEKGLKICVWINPYIGQKSPLFDVAMAKGYFIKRTNGDVWQWDKWQAGLAVIDFTNPEAVTWYQDQLRGLLEMGVDSFKTDFGERIPTEDVRYYDGSDPERMHNYYSYVYNEVVFDLLKEVRGEEDAVVFARSGTTGSPKFPVHWGGDCTADYPSMAESLRAGLSFGLSGFSFWSHDIGGFESGVTADLYKRWTQFGLLSSHSRYHGSWEYKVPWLYGEEAVDVTREFTKLKLRLMPYLLSQSRDSVAMGLPLLRAMLLEFPADLTAQSLDRQYMLGEKFLVAPIFNDRGEADFYVPQGKWTNYLTNEVHEGAKWHKQTYDYHSLPLLVKPESLIIEGGNDRQAEYDYAQGVTAHLFELETEVQAVIPDKTGKTVASISVKRTAQGYLIESEGLTSFKVMFRNLLLTGSLSGGEVTQTELGTLVSVTGQQALFQLG